MSGWPAAKMAGIAPAYRGVTAAMSTCPTQSGRAPGLDLPGHRRRVLFERRRGVGVPVGQRPSVRVRTLLGASDRGRYGRLGQTAGSADAVEDAADHVIVNVPE